MSDATESFLNINGTTVQYYVEGTGEPLLWLPGYAVIWEGTKGGHPLLSEQFQIVGLNWPGFGQSEQLACPHTVENYARFLLDFKNRSHISCDRAVASSLGALIALRALQLDRQAFSKLVITTPSDDYGHLWYGKLVLSILHWMGRRNAIRVSRFLINRQRLVKAFTKFLLPHSSKDRERVSRYWLNISRRIAIDTSYDVLTDLLSNKWTDLYRDIPIPVLMVVGEKDKIARLQRAQDLATLSAQINLLVLSKEDHHFSSSENRNLVDSKILKFLRAP